MKLSTEIILVFKNKEGDKKEIETTFNELLNKDVEDYYEDLEDDCTNSGCNNESQNFCDCGGQYEDYEISEINLK